MFQVMAKMAEFEAPRQNHQPFFRNGLTAVDDPQHTGRVDLPGLLALAIMEKALGPEHPNVAIVYDSYAALLRETSRDSRAAEMEGRANSIRAKYE